MLAAFEAVGGALEGDGAVGSVVVAVAQEAEEPEEEVQHVEGNDEEAELLVEVDGLVAHFAGGERGALVEDEGEEGDGAVGAEGEAAGVNRQGATTSARRRPLVVFSTLSVHYSAS